MTFYTAPAPNPYRASTGSMPIGIPHSPDRSKFEETCGSCGSSYTDEHLLPINTPFSGTPNASANSLHPPHHHHRTRRASNAHEPPQVWTRYHNGALVLEPATSSYTHGSERRRRPSVSGPSASASTGALAVPRYVPRRAWATYQNEIDITEGDALRRGTTRFPRKLVNKEAVQQTNLPFQEERGGTIVVLRALPRAEIEHLVELTESIRAHRHHSHHHKKEKHVRIISHPTDTIEHPADSPRRHRRESFSGPAPTQVVHHYVDPRHSSHRLVQAEEEAAAAAAKARERGHRAQVSGSWFDGKRAEKARYEAEEKARIADDVARKERKRQEVIVVR